MVSWYCIIQLRGTNGKPSRNLSLGQPTWSTIPKLSLLHDLHRTSQDCNSPPNEDKQAQRRLSNVPTITNLMPLVCKRTKGWKKTKPSAHSPGLLNSIQAEMLKLYWSNALNTCRPPETAYLKPTSLVFDILAFQTNMAFLPLEVYSPLYLFLDIFVYNMSYHTD